MKKDSTSLIIGAFFGIGGFVIIGLNAGWAAAFGVYACLIGNNIEQSLRRYNDKP